MAIRGFLVGLLFFILMFWGPEQSLMGVPDWAIHLLFAAVLSAAAWFGLYYVWRIWKPDAGAEDRLSRAVAGALAGAMFVGAVWALQAESHEECDYEVRTRDGTECVGDYVTVPGPDLFEVFLLALGGAVALYLSFRGFGRQEKDKEEPES